MEEQRQTTRVIDEGISVRRESREMEDRGSKKEKEMAEGGRGQRTADNARGGHGWVVDGCDGIDLWVKGDGE